MPFSQVSTDWRNRLSGSDALAVLEVVHGALCCRSEDDFRSLFTKLQTLFSFDFASSVLGYLDRAHGFVGKGEVNISFPEEWLRAYHDENYMQVDSIVLENFTTYDVQYWSVDRKAKNRKKEITQLGMDFGMKECYTHGFQPIAAGRTGSMFVFAGSAMEPDARIAAILNFTVPHLHAALTGISREERYAVGNIRLSQREKEVLDWLKQGKSSWDISMILGISERTVNFHVYNTMRKLKATSRPQVLAAAMRLGLIDLD